MLELSRNTASSFMREIIMVMVSTTQNLLSYIESVSLAARPSSPPGNEITETRKGEEGLAEPAWFIVA